MRREHMIVRVLRAFSGKTQEQIAEELGVDSSLIAQFELGKVLPSQDHLEQLANGLGLTLPDARTILCLFDSLCSPRFRQSQTFQEMVEGLQDAVTALARATSLMMLGAPMPSGPPGPEERRKAEELFQGLEALSQEERLAVVQAVDECQTWALLERVFQAVDQEAPRNHGKAAAWVEVAQELAANIGGPEEWRERVRQYAAEYAAKVPGCLPS